jgi:hypothetical protein
MGDLNFAGFVEARMQRNAYCMILAVGCPFSVSAVLTLAQ